jgi:hypothetical protein
VFRESIRLATVVILLIGCSSNSVNAQNWPTFRGEFARGVADGQALPDQWDIKTGKNIRWRTEIPGMGHSSPVIWGDRVFLTSAVAENIPGFLAAHLPRQDQWQDPLVQRGLPGKATR